MDVAGLIKKGTPSAWPDELTIVDDPKHALYSESIHDEIKEERVRNLLIVGQVQPVNVRAEGEELLVVAGRRRWKHATVINALSGARPYKGKLASVREAIEKWKGTDLAKLCADRCSTGMKLRFLLHRGTAEEAAGAFVSENDQRDDDPLATKVRRAQRLEKHGHSAEDIATYSGVGVQTVKRWLARDLSKPAPKGKRGKATRPSAKKLRAVFEALPADDALRIPIGWMLGEVTEEKFIANCPDLAEALRPAKKAKAA